MNGQAQTFQLTGARRTLNMTDSKGMKQGKWIIHVDELKRRTELMRREAASKRKERGRRIYNLNNDLIGMENYRFGGKDGIQQYFTYLGDMIRGRKLKGYNPDCTL
jgi:hypothetical protein